VSSLGPSASALGLFLAPGCPCRRKALVATQHNRIIRKKSSAAMMSPRCWCLDRFAAAHFRAADAERREA
jgi:hypothetical protein